MKEIIKAFYILAFLGIMIPFGKLTVPNGGILLIMLLQSTLIFSEEINLEIFTMLIMSLIVSTGLLLILFEKKMLNLIGIALNFVWLSHLLYHNKWEDIKETLLLITFSFYLLMTFVLIYQLFYNKKTESFSKLKS